MAALIRSIATVTLLLTEVWADSTSSFIFPDVSDSSQPGVFGADIRNNDSMILEWSNMTQTPYIALGLSCTDDEQVALNKSGDIHNYAAVPSVNTGKARLDIAMSASYFEDTPALYCYLNLYNNSIDTCGSGPWGTGIFNLSANSPQRTPMFMSPVFRVQVPNPKASPTLWMSPASHNDPEISKLAPPELANVTCPPGGIPSGPPIQTTSIDFWPPMQTGLVFPTKMLY